MASPIPGYQGYEGWDPVAAQADFKATGGAGKGGPSSNGGGGPNFSIPDPVETAKRLNQFQIEQNQPAIQSYQGQIPEVQQQYAQQKTALQSQEDPLKQRYQSLLQDITNRQTNDVNSQTKITSQEYGNRGIPLSSNMYQQEVQDKLNPINQNYAQLANQTGLSENQDLLGLANQIAALGPAQTNDIRTIQNAIAQLQAGNPQASITGAIGAGQNSVAAAQAQSQYQIAQQQNAFNQLKQQQDYGLQQQNYGLEQQKLAQALAQQQIANQFTQQGLGIQGGNLGVAQAHLALDQNQYNQQYGNSNAPAYFTPAK